MKKIIACASILALAACAEPATEEEAAPEEAVEEAAESAVVPGTYEVTWEDGTVMTTTINDDGTFTSSVGDESRSGTVTEEDGKACFDTDGDEEGALCWTAGEPAEDGSVTSTADDGQVVTVRVAEAEAAEEAAE